MALNQETIRGNMERFNAIQSRARKLIQMDAVGKIDEVKRKAKAKGSWDIDGEGENAVVVNNMKKNTINETYQGIPQTQMVNNKKLPKEILESFQNKQINTSALGIGISGANGGSILDDLNAVTNGETFKEVEVIKEQEVPKVQEQQTVVTSQNIDYSMIRMIVEDCMKRYTSALKKSILSESKNLVTNESELRAMKIGDKFSFITKNGDLYEAKLEFKKNINNIQKPKQ